MKHFDRSLMAKTSSIIYRMLMITAIGLMVGGILSAPIQSFPKQLMDIFSAPGTLLSDYFMIGGMGAALFNSGLVIFISLMLTKQLKLSYNGMGIAAIMIMGGFALFGKNPLNIAPILLGNYLFSVAQKEKWSRYIYIGLFSSCLAPFVSKLYFDLPFTPIENFIVAVFVGIVIGFVIPALAPHTASIHMGYNLYNVGFAAGFIALALMSLLRGLSFDSQTVMVWQKGVSIPLAVGCYGAMGILFIAGFLLSGRSLPKLFQITRHSGRAIADFVFMDGIGVTFMNMAVMGILCLSFIILIGGDLNGPTLGAIMTTMGFSAFGIHPKNSWPITAGVLLGTVFMQYSVTDPAIQLSAIFGLALAPIAGQYGAVCGIIAGLLHCSIVTSIGSVYGGLNLYNNGFSAGLVALILVPILDSFRKEV